MRPIEVCGVDPPAETEVSDLAAVVRMKAGSEGPAIFLFPGSIGSLAQLEPLVAHIKLPITIYGVKPRGSDPGEPPLGRIEDMAEYAIDKIRLVDKKGPYLLAGFSAGGLVALDAARRLSARGANVALLALIDSYPSEKTWPLTCHIEVLAKQLVRRCLELQAAPLRAMGPFIKERFRGILAYMWRTSLGPVAWRRPAAANLPNVEQSLHNATAAASIRYLPPYYSGTIIFFKASEVDMRPSDPSRLWDRFARKVEVCEVPGSHLGILDEDVESLAAQLSLFVERASEHLA